MRNTKKKYNRIAFVISLALLILWSCLGTSTSIAWFSDTSDDVKNTFCIADFGLELSYKNELGDYEEVTPQTSVFKNDALYEPGYIQIVYLKVKNIGDVPFEYNLEVDINSVNIAKNIWGTDIYLPDHLKFGVIYSDSESNLVRETAKLSSQLNFPKDRANYPLNTYSEKDSVQLEPGKERYIAVIVRMPEEVGNAANYRDNSPPSVDLGLSVTASQIKN